MGHIALLVAGILVGMLRAKILVSMWAWFVVPLGAPDLTFAVAFGLMLTIGLVRGISHEILQDRGEGEYVTLFFLRVFHAFLILGAGWIIKTAMLTGAG